MLVVASSFFMLFLGFELGGFQSSMVSMTESFSLSNVQSSYIVASQYFSIVLMPLIFGRLSDKVGKKIVLTVFTVVFFAGAMLSFMADSILLLCLGVFLIGGGYSVFESVSSAAMSDKYGLNGDKYINIAQGCICLGAFLSPFICQAFLSWRYLFLVSAIGSLLSLVLVVLISKSDFKLSVTSSTKLDFSLFGQTPIFLMLFLIILIYVGLENGIGYFMDILFSKTLNAPVFSSLAIGLYWAMMALSRFLSSFISIGHYKQLEIRFLTIAVLFILLFVSNNPILSVVICALTGFAYGPVWSIVMNLGANEFPNNTGSANGVMSCGMGIGGVCFPIIMGASSDAIGIKESFLFLCLASLIALILSKLCSSRRSD